MDAKILANTAKLFGEEDDYQKYSELAANIKKEINSRFFDPKTAIYGSGFQTELSTALFWGIVPEEYVEKVANNLAKKVILDNSHIDVGLLGSKAILNALSENGHPDLAYKVATQDDFPSWGAWVKEEPPHFLRIGKWTRKEKGPCPETTLCLEKLARGSTKPWEVSNLIPNDLVLKIFCWSLTL